MGAALVQSLSSASSFINQDFAIHLIVLGAVTMVAATFFSVARRERTGRAVERGKVLHHLVRAADCRPAPEYLQHSVGMTRASLVDRSVGSVQTGFGLSAHCAMRLRRSFLTILYGRTFRQ